MKAFIMSAVITLCAVLSPAISQTTIKDKFTKEKISVSSDMQLIKRFGESLSIKLSERVAGADSSAVFVNYNYIQLGIFSFREGNRLYLLLDNDETVKIESLFYVVANRIGLGNLYGANTEGVITRAELDMLSEHGIKAVRVEVSANDLTTRFGDFDVSGKRAKKARESCARFREYITEKPILLQ